MNIVLLSCYRWLHRILQFITDSAGDPLWASAAQNQNISEEKHNKSREQGKSEGSDSCDRPNNLTQIVDFSPVWPWIWWMTPKNNKARLLYYIQLCVSFHIHQWIQTGVTVRKRPIWVKFDDFYIRVTLQFDIWPWKTIGHLFLYYFKLYA